MGDGGYCSEVPGFCAEWGWRAVVCSGARGWSLGYFTRRAMAGVAALCEGRLVVFLDRGCGLLGEQEELTDVLARIGSWSQGWVDELMPDCRRTASV